MFRDPGLGRRRLYPTIGTKKDLHRVVGDMLNFTACADRTDDLIDISNLIQVPACRLFPIVDKLVSVGLLTETTKSALPNVR
jgi:aminopeptidase-like protein